MRRQNLIWMFMGLLLTASLSAGEFKLPKYKKVTLNNGLTVYLMERHEVPLVSLSAVFPAGAVEDGEHYGLASMTAEALLFGTEKHSKSEIEETLEALGARYNSGAGMEAAELSASFLVKDVDVVLPLLVEVMTSPVFDAAAFDKAKQRRLQRLELAKEQPQRVVGAYFSHFLAGDHAYGRPISGLKSTVMSIDRDAVKAFYEAHYGPQGTAIAIVGDFKTGEMEKRLKKLLNGWQARTRKAVTVPPANFSYQKARVLLVDKPDATETQFYIGGAGIERSNPDYTAIQVVNTVLGGRFTSWLNDELRVNRGLTYGARSRFTTYKAGGLFAMMSYTRTEKTEEALDVTLDVLKRLHTEGIDAELLKSAQNYLKGQYPPRFETSGSLASLLTDMFIYNFDEAFINGFQKTVDGLTVEKVKQLINRYFPKDHLQFVLIGKADAIRDIAKKYGPLTEKAITAEGY